jgi:hypothetical protein
MSEHSQNSQLLTLRGKGGMARAASPAEQRKPSPEVVEEEEECLSFGYLRGIRDQARSIEFRFANNNRQAFPYGWLGPVQYNPSAGILLKFVGDLVYYVLIEGSNLNLLVNGAICLYDRGILRHRVTWVREMMRQEVQKAGEGEVTVERIRILSYRPDEEPQGVEWLEPFRHLL